MKENRFARGHIDLGPGFPPHPRSTLSCPLLPPTQMAMTFPLLLMNTSWVTGGEVLLALASCQPWPWPGLPISVTGGNETGSQLLSSKPATLLPEAQFPLCLYCLLGPSPSPDWTYCSATPIISTWKCEPCLSSLCPWACMAFMGHLLCTRHEAWLLAGFATTYPVLPHPSCVILS